MKIRKNSTAVFIETLERQAVKRRPAKAGDKEFRQTPEGAAPVEQPIVTEVLDEDLYKVYIKYKQGLFKFQDHTHEFTAVVSAATTLTLVNDSDVKTVGIKSMAQGHLPEGEYFCPVAMAILGATIPSNDDTGLATPAAGYVPIGAFVGMQAGRVDFIVNNAENLMKEIPLCRWIGLGTTGAGEDNVAGTIILDNTTIMKPQLQVYLNFTWKAALPALTGLKVILHGTRTASVTK